MGVGARFEIPVARWSAWPPVPAKDVADPDVRFVDASLRRRLGPLARMMLHVAAACAQRLPGLRLVFASQHGELGYTVALLRALAAREPLSPTLFSLSVHNAAAGLLSTVRADRSESTAVAAGEETLGYALLESHCQFALEPDRPVLMVYGDAPLPQEYETFGTAADASLGRGRALAVLLSRDASRLADISTEAADAEPSGEAQVAAFVRHLELGQPARWTSGATTWSWH